MSSKAALSPSTSPVYSASSRNNTTPACDTTPAPSALTTTRRSDFPCFDRLLRFTCEVPSVRVFLDRRKPKFP